MSNEANKGKARVVGSAEVTLLGDKKVELPIVEGTQGELGLDVRTLRAQTGYVTFDPGFRNTASCESDISFVDGEKGVLRYRGIPIENVVKGTTFSEVALLLLTGVAPSSRGLQRFSDRLTKHSLLHEGMRHHFEGFPPDAQPMAILSAMINSVSCYHPELLLIGDEEHLMDAAAKLLAKVRTIAAFSYKKNRGEPIVYPDPQRSYVSNLLHMMFSLPYADYEPSPALLDALELFFILHADHEQNCSTSTARMVGSSGANLFASVAAAVCALWGRLHGGANAAVVQMLERIVERGESVANVVARAKDRTSDERLWGFGHRVYKTHDPRATLLQAASKKVFEQMGSKDPLLEVALELEQTVRADDYFIERKLYPNVDFYSGIILRAVGIPLNMFTVMFAIGRMPGWIANWAEGWRHGDDLHRPRQIYTGPTKRSFTPLRER